MLALKSGALGDKQHGEVSELSCSLLLESISQVGTDLLPKDGVPRQGPSEPAQHHYVDGSMARAKVKEELAGCRAACDLFLQGAGFADKHCPVGVVDTDADEVAAEAEGAGVL
jgi:hypothetical protein